MNFHYCGGKVKKVSFFTTGNEKGCCGSKKKSMGCCKDKTSFIKIKDNHHAFGTVKLSQNFPNFIDVFQPELKFYVFSGFPYYQQNFHDPPVLYDSSIYLKHQVLLI